MSLEETLGLPPYFARYSTGALATLVEPVGYEHGPAERLTAPGSRTGFAERDASQSAVSTAAQKQNRENDGHLITIYRLRHLVGLCVEYKLIM